MGSNHRKISLANNGLWRVAAIFGSELRYGRSFETPPDGILMLEADARRMADATPQRKDPS